MWYVARHINGKWYFAATDVDWKRPIGRTTITFTTRSEAMEFIGRYCWERDVIPMCRRSP